MKRSLIWTTAGIAAIGFAVPAFAANSNSSNNTKPTVPASVTVTNNTVKNSGTDSARDIIEASTVATANVTPTSVEDNATRNSVDDNATTNSVEDISGNCDEAEHANDAACAGTAQVGDDNGVDDDATTNSVEDVSGNCDEAEHANDAACTGAAASSNTVDDNSGHRGSDDSGRGSDDSGHGSDDSGHGGNDG
jgi:hypothetical protein